MGWFLVARLLVQTEAFGFVCVRGGPCETGRLGLTQRQNSRRITGLTRALARLKVLSVRFPAAPIKASGSGHSPGAAAVFVLRVQAFHPNIVVSRLRSRYGLDAVQSAVQRDV